jgi:hypothetical protein
MVRSSAWLDAVGSQRTKASTAIFVMSLALTPIKLLMKGKALIESSPLVPGGEPNVGRRARTDIGVYSMRRLSASGSTATSIPDGPLACPAIRGTAAALSSSGAGASAGRRAFALITGTMTVQEVAAAYAEMLRGCLIDGTAYSNAASNAIQIELDQNENVL